MFFVCPDIILGGWLGSQHQLTNSSLWRAVLAPSIFFEFRIERLGLCGGGEGEGEAELWHLIGVFGGPTIFLFTFDLTNGNKSRKQVTYIHIADAKFEKISVHLLHNG